MGGCDINVADYRTVGPRRSYPGTLSNWLGRWRKSVYFLDGCLVYYYPCCRLYSATILGTLWDCSCLGGGRWRPSSSYYWAMLVSDGTLASHPLVSTPLRLGLAWPVLFYLLCGELLRKALMPIVLRYSASVL